MTRSGHVGTFAVGLACLACLACRASSPPSSLPSLPSLATIRMVVPATGLHRSEISRPFELATERGIVVLYDAGSSPTDSWPCVSSREIRGPEAQATQVDRCLELAKTDGEISIHGWAHAQVLQDRRTIVALLESKVEGPGDALDVVVSSDAGRTWIPRGSVRKRHYMAEFAGLDTKHAPSERWVLSIQLDDCAGCGLAPGVYHYESSDEGRTWKPRPR